MAYGLAVAGGRCGAGPAMAANAATVAHRGVPQRDADPERRRAAGIVAGRGGVPPVWRGLGLAGAGQPGVRRADGTGGDGHLGICAVGAPARGGAALLCNPLRLPAAMAGLHRHAVGRRAGWADGAAQPGDPGNGGCGGQPGWRAVPARCRAGRVSVGGIVEHAGHDGAASRAPGRAGDAGRRLDRAAGPRRRHPALRSGRAVGPGLARRAPGARAGADRRRAAGAAAGARSSWTRRCSTSCGSSGGRSRPMSPSSGPPASCCRPGSCTTTASASPSLRTISRTCPASSACCYRTPSGTSPIPEFQRDMLDTIGASVDQDHSTCCAGWTSLRPTVRPPALAPLTRLEELVATYRPRAQDPGRDSGA